MRRSIDRSGQAALETLIANLGGPQRFSTQKRRYTKLTIVCPHHNRVAEVIATQDGPVLLARTKHVQQGDISQPEAELTEGLADPALKVEDPLRGISGQQLILAISSAEPDYPIEAAARCGRVSMTVAQIMTTLESGDTRTILDHVRSSPVQ